jgi:hypothetical protein
VSLTHYPLIVLTLLFATGAHAEICRGILHNPGIQAGRMARIGNCNVAKHSGTEAIFDACRYRQPCEVEARLGAGEIVEVLSVPTADQVCRGRVSVDRRGVAKIRATSDVQPDPLACWFHVDSNIGRRVLHTCYKRSKATEHCWVQGEFTKDRGGLRQLVQVSKVLDF